MSIALPKWIPEGHHITQINQIVDCNSKSTSSNCFGDFLQNKYQTNVMWFVDNTRMSTKNFASFQQIHIQENVNSGERYRSFLVFLY